MGLAASQLWVPVSGAMLSIMAARLFVGTSGFAYPEWKGPFYPERLSPRKMLPFYAERFDSVEINYSFRRRPSQLALENWREATPEGFVFALKAHQRITHWLRLADAGEAVTGFLDEARLLGDRLGPILFQCPATLPYDGELLARFLDGLPPGFRYAFEFRHPSWVEARSLLASCGVAWCVAETDDQPAPDSPDPEPFVYLRLRKRRYLKRDLEAWADRLAVVLAGGRDAFVFFKHEDKGAGPKFAQRLLAAMRRRGMVSPPPPRGERSPGRPPSRGR